MFGAIADFIRAKLSQREGEKWAKRVNHYFFAGFDMTEFAKDELQLDDRAHVLCGYICGFMDILFQGIGKPQGSAEAAYAIQAVIKEEMPRKQADWLREVFYLQAYSDEPSGLFNVGRRYGAADANSYLARQQQFAFGKFLFKEYRSLCRCTHPQLIEQLSKPT